INALNECGYSSNLVTQAVTAESSQAILELGSGFASPGGNALVDLTLHGGAAAVAFQGELILPPGVTMAGCSGAERLRHQVLIKRLADNDGSERILLVGLDIGDYTDVLGDGVIATCNLTIAPDAQYGTQQLVLRDAKLSSSAGTTILPSQVGGNLTVTECSSVPRLGCVAETIAPKDSLKVVAGKKVDWRFQTMQPIAFDDPTWQHTRFCVYDVTAGSARLAIALDVPANRSWMRSGTSLWRYARRGEGIRRVELRRATSGRTRLHVQGQSPGVSLPALPFNQSNTVAAQLQTDNKCWSSLYQAPAKFNDNRRFYDSN
ncbi:MAG: hypothetical protein ACRD3J_15280, partial [Thermoanaerobaculia bacterium]